jgi:teichuronic acid biosynthesis glycosyltransferase TuaH
VMLMPFVVDRLIEAVDPVKLYEYVAFGRPALAPRYPESERFAQWVRLYNNVDEAVSSLFEMLASDVSDTSRTARAAFLAENAWSQRVIQIERLLAPLVQVAP